MKLSLIERIQDRNKDQNKDQSKKIKEKDLIEEYFRLSQGVADEDKMRALIHQVGLLKYDLNTI